MSDQEKKQALESAACMLESAAHALRSNEPEGAGWRMADAAKIVQVALDGNVMGLDYPTGLGACLSAHEPTTPEPVLEYDYNKPATITNKELHRLGFLNSPRLPLTINVGGNRHRWVGIGWVEEGLAEPLDTVLID